MTIWQAIILGIVQGLTEFLPVSSSGHLVLAQHFLGFEEPQLFFDVLVHVATLFAVGIFFFKVLLKLRFKEWMILAVGTIPAALVGVFFKDFIEGLFGSVEFVAVELMITAGLNFYADRLLGKGEKEATKESDKLAETEETVGKVRDISWKQSLIVGTFQAIAISPGISRSGSTLVGGLWQKLDRQTAFTFSFLLSVPAIAGASVLQLLDVMETGEIGLSVPVMLTGAISAFITGYASLWLFKKVITVARMEFFGWYCLILGGGSLVWFLIS